jgi:alpha-amylase
MFTCLFVGFVCSSRQRSCIFFGDLYGCGGKSPQPPVSQLADFIRARKLFAYGPTRDYWDHPNCVGWVREGDEKYDGCAVVLCNGDEGCVFLVAFVF